MGETNGKLSSAWAFRPVYRALLLMLTATLLGFSGCSQSSSNSSSSDVLSSVMKRGVLRVGIRREDPPHSQIGPGGQLVGFDVDIANAVARHLHVRLEIVPVDELTRISFLQGGKIDLAITSISHTIKRNRQIDFSQTYFFSKQTFVVKKSSGITALRQLVGKPIGATRGSNAVGNWKEWLKQHGYPSNPDVVEFGEKQAGIKAVQSGDIAGYTEDAEVLVSYARHNPGLRVILNEGTGPKLDGIGVKKDQSNMLNAVNFALQEIAKSGEYERIYNHWFGSSSGDPLPLEGHIEIWPED